MTRGTLPCRKPGIRTSLATCFKRESKASCSSSPETSTASLTVFPSRSLRVVFTSFLSLLLRGCYPNAGERTRTSTSKTHDPKSCASAIPPHPPTLRGSVLNRALRGERRDLNPRPLGPQPSALPTELRSPCLYNHRRSPRCQTPSLGAPGRIRTCGPRIRSPLLYPAELQALGSNTAAVASGRRKSGRRGSNPRHSAWKADALPTELHPPASPCRPSRTVVGTRGFEPPTPCSQSRCATRLRHVPTAAHPWLRPREYSVFGRAPDPWLLTPGPFLHYTGNVDRGPVVRRRRAREDLGHRRSGLHRLARERQPAGSGPRRGHRRQSDQRQTGEPPGGGPRSTRSTSARTPSRKSSGRRRRKSWSITPPISM